MGTKLFTKSNVEDFFEKLLSGNQELKQFYLDEISGIEVENNRKNFEVNLYFIGKKIVEMKIHNQTEDFKVLFSNVENILNNSDADIKELIFRCLFGGIKLYGRNDFDFYPTFSTFINPKIIEDYEEWYHFRIQNKPLKLIRRK